MSKSKKWSENHSKVYIALSLCIADGRINDLEKEKVNELSKIWMDTESSIQSEEVFKISVKQMMKASKGVDILDEVNKSAKHIHKALDGNKKRLFQFLKQLKSIAESDSIDNPVSESEVRIIRYVTREFGLEKKLTICLQENSIKLIKK